METLSVVEARRLALARAGLLKPEWTGMPVGPGRGEKQARAAAHRIIRRFGYLQLDTVSVAGARSHTIVLLSRLRGFPPPLAEELLRPGEPLFEYWGHEASWIPMELYPALEFRRRQFEVHPWWGDLLGQHPDVATRIVDRIAREGPLRSQDLPGKGSGGWWGLNTTRKVLSALWSSGRLCVRERKNFQRVFDLAERVVPEQLREKKVPLPEALRVLVERALRGQGWAGRRTLAETWRPPGLRKEIDTVLRQLEEKGQVIECALVHSGGRTVKGWIRPSDLELAARLRKVRPRRDQGVLLSPFDPILWDRQRVQMLFDFHQVLEIFKPAAQRIYGYYNLPVLAGDRFVARLDLKADVRGGRLRVLNCVEETCDGYRPRQIRAAVQSALDRYAGSLELAVRP